MLSLRMQKKVKGKSLLSYSQNPHNLPIQQKKVSPQWVLCTSSPSLLLPLLSSPISSQKNPWLSAQRHLHRDEKIQLHFTEIATRFFEQFVQLLTSWHRIETFSRQSSDFRKIPLYTRSTTIKQAQYYLASFSVKIDSPQEILLRPRPRPRLLLLRFLLVANNCAPSHLRYLQISSALFSNFPEYSPSRSTASPSSLSTGRATKNSKRVTRYFTGPRSGKKWEFLGPTVNCVCKTPGCPIDPMVHW